MSLMQRVAGIFRRSKKSPKSKKENQQQSSNKSKITFGIRQKLGMAFGVMTLLTLGAAGAGIYGMSDIQARFDYVANKEIPAMRSASDVISLSERFAIAAAELQTAQTEKNRTTAYDHIQGLIENLRTSIRNMANTLGENNADIAKNMKINSARLSSSVDNLNDTIAMRINMLTTKAKMVDDIFAVHEKLSAKLAPVVDTAYFNTIIGGENAGERSSKIVDKIVNKDLAEMSSAITTRAEANLIAGLLASAEFARGSDIVSVLEDKAIAAEKRLRVALSGWPQNAAKKQAQAKIKQLWSLAMTKDGIFKFKSDGLEGQVAGRAEIIGKIVSIQQSLDNLLTSAIDDFTFDMSTRAEDAVSANSKLIKDLMSKEVTALKSSLETSNSLYLLVATLVQAGWAHNDKVLVPIQGRIDSIVAKLKKDTAKLGNKDLSILAESLFKVAEAKQGIVSMRKLELNIEEDVGKQIAETRNFETKLGSNLKQLMDSQQKTINEATASVSNTIGNSKFMLFGAIGLNLVISGLIAFFVVHRGLATPISRVTQAMRQLASGNTEVELLDANRKDEIGDMSSAVLVFRDNAIEREHLRSDQEKEQEAHIKRQQRIEQLIADFRTTAQNMLESVGTNMEQMQSTAQVLTGIADDTAERASGAANASEDASNNVQTVASAAEELSSSIGEIGRQISQTTEIVNQATDEARSANDKVATLSEGAQKIGDVVSLIQDIAEQTNLLALNATIEAARAGEMGKGFAVVASEVKSLATQTAKATEEIASQISAIQGSTQEAVGAIQNISKTMEEANGYTAAIAAAVEEQSAATSDISHNVQLAATGTKDVATNMSGVTAAVSETTQSAAQVEHASGDVADQAKKLEKVVGTFLTEVAAA